MDLSTLSKCCAPQLPCQFGEGEHGVFASDRVLKTLTLLLKWYLVSLHNDHQTLPPASKLTTSPSRQLASRSGMFIVEPSANLMEMLSSYATRTSVTFFAILWHSASRKPG